jgi:hypothetical protein
MTFADLKLAPIMEDAARLFAVDFPHVQWLSGRRDRMAQARAMAPKLVTDRKWIAKTYLHAASLQSLVDYHPEVTTVDGLAALLYEHMAGMSDEELAKVSDHVSGYAVDLVPMVFGDGSPTPTGERALKWMHDYPYTKKVLTREGGRIIWHWACQPDRTARRVMATVSV